MSTEIKGSCLCGKVTYKVTEAFEQFHFCHCTRCQKATGTAHAAILFTKPEALTWLSGEELIKQFKLADAQFFAKSFCSECGSTVPKIIRDGQMLMVPAGSLDESPEIEPQDHIFWKDRACWYDASLEAPRFEEYPS
ncbi:MAG: aldehyde-activating protein [Methylococcaceae bacterium]|nr:aldehyde-activating protein [Methylococcaceae bacterium]